ncbi:dispersed gene family protein 1 (DGF-1), putative, partial [Trypanosoma cruzi]
MLLAKENVHDGVSREMLYAAGVMTAVGSTLSFVRNRALLPRMLSLNVSLATGAHVRVACNDAGGRVLSTAEEYAAAGFGDAGSIDVAGCDVCDRDTYCYAPGTASASMRNGVCVCDCGSGGYGEACVPVGAAARCGHRVETVRPRGRDGAVGVRCACRRERGDVAPRCAGRRVSGALRAVDGAGRRADRCAGCVAAERCCALRDGRWRLARCGCCGEQRERAGGAVGVRCGGAERCACAERHVSRGV